MTRTEQLRKREENDAWRHLIDGVKTSQLSGHSTIEKEGKHLNCVFLLRTIAWAQMNCDPAVSDHIASERYSAVEWVRRLRYHNARCGCRNNHKRSHTFHPKRLHERSPNADKLLLDCMSHDYWQQPKRCCCPPDRPSSLRLKSPPRAPTVPH